MPTPSHGLSQHTCDVHPQAPPKTKAGKATLPAEPRLSRTRRPKDVAVADWQAALRRQFGREQDFTLKNLGSERVWMANFQFNGGVPEPATWALMIVGFGLVGVSMRRPKAAMAA